ncbi:MAG: nucleoside-diphosphate kinase [Candidatus Aenigmatarchaeota archaeon]
MERTLVLIKPDAIERKLIGEIIKRFEQANLKIVALKMLKATRAKLAKHYVGTKEYLISLGNKTLSNMKKEEVEKIFGSLDPYKIGKTIRNWLIEYLNNKEVVAIVLEGENAVQKVREIVGFTDPSKAAKGTIRGDFGEDSIEKANSEKRAVRNLVHASGSKEEAEKEILIWFGKNYYEK